MSTAARSPVPTALPSGHVGWLTASLILVIAPHASRLPLWVSLFALLMALWRMHMALRCAPLPGRAFLLLISVAGGAGIYASYGTLLGRDAGIALLAVMCTLKLLEMRRERDAMMVAFLAYFLVITSFLYDQSMVVGAYMVVAVMTITGALAGLGHPYSPPGRERLRLAGKLLAQAVPVALAMFLLFPRVQGPLWGLPQDAFSGVSGLSETMSPGTLSRLSLSDAVAFRAVFESTPPGKAFLYWRGPVLTDFDGRTWSGASNRPLGDEASRIEYQDRPISYEVTLEPHQKRWLFALDVPAEAPPRSYISRNFQVLATQPVRNRVRYEASSYLVYRAGLPEDPDVLDRSRALPDDVNPRTRELARRWRGEGLDDRGVLERALAMFRGESFFYTLTPPLLGANSVDEFLFGSKRGFCEHYAGSLAFLLRAAGVPARVVTGYQGGELNTVGNYLLVRQSDAHAWVEAWLPESGWTRVDPTAAVAPERVQSGIAAALPAGEPLPLMVRMDSEWLRRAHMMWDASANAWNQWVLGYSPERQVSLLTRAGMEQVNWQQLAFAMFVAVSLLLGGLGLLMLRRYRILDDDRVQRSWTRFCRKLSRGGLPRRPSEGPLDYARRIAHLRPELGEAAGAIAELYARLRYGPPNRSRADEQELRRLVRAFRA